MVIKYLYLNICLLKGMAPYGLTTVMGWGPFRQYLQYSTVLCVPRGLFTKLDIAHITVFVCPQNYGHLLLHVINYHEISNHV